MDDEGGNTQWSIKSMCIQGLLYFYVEFSKKRG